MQYVLQMSFIVLTILFFAVVFSGSCSNPSNCGQKPREIVLLRAPKVGAAALLLPVQHTNLLNINNGDWARQADSSKSRRRLLWSA